MIQKKRLVDLFVDLVRIDSPSGDEQLMVKKISGELKKLGARVERDKFGNVIGHLEGKGEPFMLNAHLDTVEPGRGIKPIIKGDTIKSSGDTILGADPKAGVAEIIEALTSLKEDKANHLPLDIVFTLGEETGLLGAQNLDYSKVPAKCGLTFDGEEAVHNITISGPGYNRIDATITGKSAHAGVEPEKGISAIKILSEIITNLSVGRIDHETTANIGLIEGGSARNAVPETASFKAEIRSRNAEKIDLHTIHFKKTFDKVMRKHPEATYNLDIIRVFNPYLFDENHSVIKKIKNIFTDLEINPSLDHSGGGTDVNIFHTNGIEAVCVGTGAYAAHTKREYALISQMMDAANFCRKMIEV